MKWNRIWVLATLVLVTVACSKEESVNTSENLSFEIAQKIEYRGVFTTLDGSERATVFVVFNNSIQDPIATFNFDTGKTLQVKGSKQTTLKNEAEYVFENQHISFDLNTNQNALEATFSNVTYEGLEGDIIGFLHTNRAPVTPINGTYDCGSCNGHPVLGQGDPQTFNMVFVSSAGEGNITTQVTLGGISYNTGIGYQEDCIANGFFTSCAIESGDGSTTITGFLANGNPVIWDGEHFFNNEPTGPNDCSGVSGTWEWQSQSYGLIAGTFESTTSCLTELVFEDFEDATVEYTTSISEFTDGSNDYFTRTDGSNISGGVNYSDIQGSSFFAAQDIDGEGANALQFINFDAIDVSSYSAVTFSAFFAEDTAGNGDEDWDDSTSTSFDYLDVQYSFDNGVTWVTIFAINADPATTSGSGFNGQPKVDTNLDTLGDGDDITDALTEYTAQFSNNATTNPGGSSTVDIRIAIRLDSGDEDIAIDNVRISGL